MGDSLSGQVALVTGSSSRIGKAIALRFAEDGADLVITGRDPVPGARVVRQIEGMGRRATFVTVDLTDFAAVQRMVDEALARLGRVDILVASASGRTARQLGFRPFADLDPALYHDYALAHWFAKAYPVKAILPHMRERQRGKIVIVTTDAGRTPTVGEAILGGAGAATIQMVRTLGKEFLRHRIHINAIAVSIVDTREGEPQDLMGRSEFAERIFEKLRERQTFPVVGRDVAEAALFLASGGSDTMTGQVISINGGISIP